MLIEIPSKNSVSAMVCYIKGKRVFDRIAWGARYFTDKAAIYGSRKPRGSFLDQFEVVPFVLPVNLKFY